MKQLFDAKKILIESLEYREYSRPYFFLQKQKESGWEKGIFLLELNEAYYALEEYFNIKYRIQHGKNKNINIEDIVVTIKELTGIEQNGQVSKKELDELHKAILICYEIDKPKQEFTSYEVVSFVQYALNFIHSEYLEQLRKAKDYFSRPRTESYFIYLIASEAPFFNFPQFRNEVRQLVLTVNNVKELRHLLKPFYNTAVEIVDLWNKEIWELENNSENNVENIRKPEMALVEFKYRTLNHSWWTDQPLFEIKGPSLYRNQDFASFAAKIANFLSSEIFKGKSVEIRLRKGDFIKDFIDGIYDLQDQGIKAESIRVHRDNKKRDESLFRNYFQTWFRGRRYIAEAEPQKGNGRIDLKVSNDIIGNKIIEFKGWWNPDKSNLPNQVHGYLTEFEREGYIFMINHEKHSIVDDYRLLIMSPDLKCDKNGLEEIVDDKTGYKYYKSRHIFPTGEKLFYHFIFPIYV